MSADSNGTFGLRRGSRQWPHWARAGSHNPGERAPSREIVRHFNLLFLRRERRNGRKCSRDHKAADRFGSMLLVITLRGRLGQFPFEQLRQRTRQSHWRCTWMTIAWRFDLAGIRPQKDVIEEGGGAGRRYNHPQSAGRDPQTATARSAPLEYDCSKAPEPGTRSNTAAKRRYSTVEIGARS
jgi:hypothetical protein